MDLGHQKVYFSRDIIFHAYVFLMPILTLGLFFLPVSSSLTYEEASQLLELAHTSAEPSHNEASDTIFKMHYSPQLVRRSSRTHRSPSHLEDYVHSVHIEPLCFATLTNVSIRPPVFPVHCLHSSSQNLLDRLDFTEPQSYDEVVPHPGWQSTMAQELQALQDINT